MEDSNWLQLLASLRDFVLPVFHGLLGFAARILVSPIKTFFKALVLGTIVGIFAFSATSGMENLQRGAIIGICIFLSHDVLEFVVKLCREFSKDPSGSLAKIIAAVKGINK